MVRGKRFWTLLWKLRDNGPFLVATEPVDAEPTLSSMAMHEGMTKEGSGLPDGGERRAGGRCMRWALVPVALVAYLHSQAWYNPFRCP